MKLVYSLMIVLGLASACKDSEDSAPAVANDEAADMVASSMSSSSGGLTVMIDAAVSTTAANTSARVQACGYSGTDTQTKSNAAGALITYSFQYVYNYALTCDAGSPLAMTANATYSGMVDGARMSSESHGNAELVVSSLDASMTSFLVNGSFTREGSFVSKVRDQNTSQSTLEFTLGDISVDKTTRTINGGTAIISISGTVSGKGNFSYTGSITFIGNKTAVLDVNGVKYNVNIETGDVSAI